MNIHPEICVFGTGRSGTGHFTGVASDLGLDIGHETQGRDGISSWCLVSELPRSPFGPSCREVDWNEHLACLQLRNPLQTIPSLETINQSSWAFILEDGQTRLDMGWWRRASIRKRAMWHWLDWNQRAHERSQVHWTLQDAGDIGPSLAKGTGRTSLHSDWKKAWIARKNNANNAQSRVPMLSTLLKTSPPVAFRRIKYAYVGGPLDESQLFKEDPILAQEIMTFWGDLQRSSASVHRS